mmetsp:Transcript_7253/g.21017  ORF Transcript_7253/g.21017 Transcript_7253/m.21017 type:complete len:389 (+) Transcript_7253:200-1366(+)
MMDDESPYEDPLNHPFTTNGAGSFIEKKYAFDVENDERYNKSKRARLSARSNMYLTSSAAPTRTFPPDTYSFIAVHGPLDKSLYFYFGLMVWVFQVAFFLLLVLRVASKKLSTNEDTDNPDDTFFSGFIPSNVGEISRVAQFFALVSYCIFADESLRDVVTAVEMWPTASKAKPGDNLGLLRLSSILRFIQGSLATIVVLLLVVSTADVVDIVLNFMAVNFVSGFDDIAFELAQWGKYGTAIEAEAKRIEDLPVPECLRRRTKFRRFWSIIFPTASALLVSLIIVVHRQNSLDYWLTRTLRVQFEDDTNLEPYSGCYSIDTNFVVGRIREKRVQYQSFDANPGSARFGYCQERRKWFIYEGNYSDSCAESEDQLAYSDITYTFGKREM